jgi:branched-chain amino acid transport system permease protein
MTAAHEAQRSQATAWDIRTVVRESAIWVVLAVLFAVLPVMFPSGLALTMMSLMGISIVFALSYNVLMGQTGLLSFGHAVYYGLAGFVAIHAMNLIARNGLPIPLPLVPLFAGLAGLFFGIVFGWLSTRRAGTVFAMISLGLAELVAACSLIMRGFFGGEEGVTTNRTKLEPFLGLKFGPQIEVYYLIAAWTFVCILAMYAMTRTPFGRMANAVRENPERAEFVGYSTQAVRFIAFCIAAFFAGIAGGLAAINFEIMNAASVGAQQSGVVLLMAFIGGIGAFAGPIVGAILITFLQIMLSDITGAWLLYFGIMFILCVMFFPGGIVGWVLMHEPAVRTGQLGRLVVPYLLVTIPLAIALIGGIVLIELAHHMLVKAEEGSQVHVLYMTLNGTSLVPWIASLALILGGSWLTVKLWPHVSDAWGAILAKAHGRDEP